MMTDAAEVERILLTLCEDHYTQWRRVPTALAVPIGFIKRLAAGYLGVTSPERIVVYHCGAPVSLEELEQLTWPVVLSDRRLTLHPQ